MHRLTPYSPLIAGSRLAAVILLIALIGLNLGWELWWAPLRPGGSWWAIKVLPLCLPLAGLLKYRLYTYRWLSLLIWLYFIESTVRTSSDHGLSAVLAAASSALCLVLFVALVAHIRLRLKSAYGDMHGPQTLGVE